MRKMLLLGLGRMQIVPLLMLSACAQQPLPPQVIPTPPTLDRCPGGWSKLERLWRQRLTDAALPAQRASGPPTPRVNPCDSVGPSNRLLP